MTIEQLEIVEETGRRAYVVYTENVAKNNTGGYAQRKLAAKPVVHHANLFSPERCFVRMLRPTFLIVRQKPQRLFISRHLKPQGAVFGILNSQLDTTHSATVKRLCNAAGISGFKTNHSLRVTAATRLCV